MDNRNDGKSEMKDKDRWQTTGNDGQWENSKQWRMTDNDGWQTKWTDNGWLTTKMNVRQWWMSDNCECHTKMTYIHTYLWKSYQIWDRTNYLFNYDKLRPPLLLTYVL